jgi:spermidine synthase
MSRSWEILDRVDTPDGILELRRRGDEFLIAIAGRILMNSHANRSEVALANLGLGAVRGTESPHVLIGGLGMGCTLRAALDTLPRDARLLVSEKNPVVARWCAGPLAGVNRDALADPRVEVAIEDVSKRIAESARAFDAILLDLYEGPHAATDPKSDPFYGRSAVARTRAALALGGVFCVWSENADDSFERRLRSGGFAVETRRPGRGGRRHAVTIARTRSEPERPGSIRTDPPDGA